MTALRRTEKENADYEKPEGRHPVTDLPTQKNETMQTPPCNLNVCRCKKRSPNRSESTNPPPYHRCGAQSVENARVGSPPRPGGDAGSSGTGSSASSEGGGSSRSYSTGGADSSPMFLRQSIQANGQTPRRRGRGRRQAAEEICSGNT